MKKLAVFCGASIGYNDIYKNHAIALGAYLAKRKISMVYGGGKIGIMGTIADEMLKQKGEVIGVIPHLLRLEEVEHDKITRMIVSEKMSDRKVIISKMVDGYIALPGGYGTLDEIFEVLAIGQLGIEKKPVGILNTNGFYNKMIEQLDVMVNEGFLQPEYRKMLFVDDSIERLIVAMEKYKAPIISKIVKTVGS